MSTEQKDNPNVHHFPYLGRDYTLYKRQKSRKANWILETVILGKRIVRSMGTNQRDNAEDIAIKQHIKPALDGKPQEASKLRDGFAKLGEIFNCYREMSLGKTKDRTVNANVQAFRLVVRRGMGSDGTSDGAVDALSSSVLTGKLVSDFEDWMAREAITAGRDVESNKRSVGSYLRHARSVFKESFLQRYPEKEIRLPDLRGFMERTTEQGAVVDRLPVDDLLLARTVEGLKKLRIEDRPAHVALMLGLCSLRRGEISIMQWSWLKQVDGLWWIRLPAPVVKGKRDRLVPMDQSIAAELLDYQIERQKGLNTEEEQFVLPSARIGQGATGKPQRLRAQNVFKRASDWMRAQGWTTNHTLHELRAFTISMVQDDYDLNVAQAVAGHANQQTTQKNYTGKKRVANVVVTLPFKVA